MIVALPRMMSPPHRTVALALGQATKWAGQHREHVTAVPCPGLAQTAQRRNSVRRQRRACL
jgi:hypothetical protein